MMVVFVIYVEKDQCEFPKTEATICDKNISAGISKAGDDLQPDLGISRQTGDELGRAG
jgi:hypothetical protein